MKNLKPYKDCSSTFLDDVIKAKNNSKKDPDYKDRVEILKPNIKIKYSTFDTEHTANSLTSLTAHG